MNGLRGSAAGLLLIGSANEIFEALMRYGQRTNPAMVADAAAARAFLQAHRLVPPRLMVMAAAMVDSVAAIRAIEALKSDPVGQRVPLAVVCSSADGALLEACYRAGANACLCKPAEEKAVHEAAVALVDFWCSANELPPSTV